MLRTLSILMIIQCVQLATSGSFAAVVSDAWLLPNIYLGDPFSLASGRFTLVDGLATTCALPGLDSGELASEASTSEDLATLLLLIGQMDNVRVGTLIDSFSLIRCHPDSLTPEL